MLFQIYPSSKYEYFPVILLLANRETLFNLNIVLSALLTITCQLTTVLFESAIGRE